MCACARVCDNVSRRKRCEIYDRIIYVLLINKYQNARSRKLYHNTARNIFYIRIIIITYTRAALLCDNDVRAVNDVEVWRKQWRKTACRKSRHDPRRFRYPHGVNPRPLREENAAVHSFILRKHARVHKHIIHTYCVLLVAYSEQPTTIVLLFPTASYYR